MNINSFVRKNSSMGMNTEHTANSTVGKILVHVQKTSQICLLETYIYDCCKKCYTIIYVMLFPHNTDTIQLFWGLGLRFGVQYDNNYN